MQATQLLLAQAAESTSWQDRLGDGELMGLAILVIPSLLILLAIVFELVNKVNRRNADTSLKREMIEGGMSAEEIERVLAARSTESKK